VVDGEDRVHRALAEPSRVRLLGLLEASAAPLASENLAAATGLHPNTVRAHLDVLVDAGLASSTLETRSRPGRPRRLFAALPRDERLEHEHAQLATALAGSLDPLPDGPRLAEDAGRRWGGLLVRGSPPAPEQAVERVVELLAEHGFAPVARPGEITMCNCPFREVAERYERVVCALHKGLLNGALDGLGAPVEVAELHPWAEPGRCVARLAVRAGS
jgi:predicted ArsR family transcriptional regulator